MPLYILLHKVGSCND